MGKQFIKAEWYTPRSLKKAVESGSKIQKLDYISQGLKPEANNPSRILCELKNMPLAYYDIPTSNKQLFQKQLWDKLLSNEDLISRMRETRSFWGEPFHADSMEIMLPNVSHKVTDFHIDKNNIVSGDVAIVDTPNGNIIYSLLQDAWVGISSRGYGSLLDMDDGSGQIVSADDYYHVSWDFVGVPAVQAAMATLASYAKSSKLEEPIFRSLLASSASVAGLQSVAQGLKSMATPVAVTVPDLSGVQSAEEPAAPEAVEVPSTSYEGIKVVERDDGAFWLENADKTFEQGPYTTKEEADARLATAADHIPEVKPGEGEASIEAAQDPEFIKEFQFAWNTNNVPFPKQGEDGKWYVQFGKDIRLGPFASEEEVMRVIRQQSPRRDSVGSSRAYSVFCSYVTEKQFSSKATKYEARIRKVHPDWFTKDVQGFKAGDWVIVHPDSREHPGETGRVSYVVPGQRLGTGVVMVSFDEEVPCSMLSHQLDQVDFTPDRLKLPAPSEKAPALLEALRAFATGSEDLIKSGWAYDEAHGGIALTYDGKDVAFLQGDEASELSGQLEAAGSEEEVNAILDPYLVLLEQSKKAGDKEQEMKVLKQGKTTPKASPEAVKSSTAPAQDPAPAPVVAEDLPPDVSAGLPEDGAGAMSEEETRDRQEFSEMVLLELAEALETDDDMGEEPLIEGDTDDIDNSTSGLTASAKPVKSAEGDFPPAADDEDSGEGDDFSEDEFFPVEEEGSITVDETAGSITVETVGDAGDTVSVDLTLEDGMLSQSDIDQFGPEDELETSGPSVLPGGKISVDLFEEVNGDVSAAVDYILDLGVSGNADGTVLDMTEDELEDDDDGLPESTE